MKKYFTAVFCFLFLLSGAARALEAGPSEADSLKFVVDSINLQKNTARMRWSFGLHGGYSYRLPNAGTRSANPYSRYLKKLKTGYAAGAEAHRFFWPRVGLGLKYNIYKSEGKFDIANKDNIAIQFIGPSAVYQSPFANGKTSVLAGFAMGYQSYKNKGRAAGENFILKGNATGWAVSLGLEQKLSSHLAINLSGACYLGTVYKFERKSANRTETIKLSDEKFENLSRAEVTLGLKFLN